MKNLLQGNPIIQRYRFSLMRPRNFFIYLATYLIILFLLLLINIAAKASITSVFTQVLSFQIILVFWATYNSSVAIKEEVMEKTHDFFRMLPLSAHQKATGILVGKNAVVLLFLAVNFVFLVSFGLQAMDVFQLVQIVLALLCGAFCVNAIALLSSNMTVGAQRKKSGNILLLVFVIFLVSPLIGIIARFHDSQWAKGITMPFYNVQIPVLLFIAAIALYGGIWAYWGTIRKFVKENECLFARVWAVVFFLGCELVLVGIFLPHLGGRGDRELTYGFWAATLVPLLLISLASIRTFDKYWDKSMMLTGNTKPSFMRAMFLFSNTGLAVLLYTIWTAFAVGFAAYASTLTGSAATIITTFLLSYIFLVLLVELWALYRPDSEKIAILLVVIAVVYLILPLICAGIFDTEGLMVASPFGLIPYFMDEQSLPTKWCIGLLAYNVIICILPAIKVYQKWARIRENRHLIDKQKVAG